MQQPNIIDIELTNVCNLACKFCLRPLMTRPVGFMPMETYKKVIDEISTYKFPQWGKVVFAGFGEPTLHPDFIEMTGYAASKNLPLIIYSNGTNLKPEIRRALLNPGIRDVKLSVNVHGQAMLTETTGSNIRWEKMVNDILALMQEHYEEQNAPPITLQLLYTGNLSETVRQQETPILDSEAQVDEALGFWHEITAPLAKEFNFSRALLPGFLDLRQVSTLLPGVQIKLCPYLPYKTHFTAERTYPSGLDFRSCQRHENNVVIFQDGTVTPCCTDVNCRMKLGSIHQQTILEIFNAPMAISNRNKWAAGKCPQDLCKRCLNTGQ